jgi:ABC-type transport system involved in multi-copper enzyme maturation permease subunit
MILLPIVGRELTAESRRPFNYWLRVIGAAALTLVLGLTFLDTHSTSLPRFGVSPGQNPFGNLGTRLFGNLNATIFLTLWILVPLLTADCINREKREGTLGLLFLTPLTSTGIVIGKGLVHGLRALTLYFTMLPVLVVPLMLGGVTVQDGLMAALLNLASLLLALAAGLLASAWTRDWLKSIALAYFLAALFAIAFMTAQHDGFQNAVDQAALAPGKQKTVVVSIAGVSYTIDRHYQEWSHSGPLSRIRELFHDTTNQAFESKNRWRAAWSDVWSGPPAIQNEWFHRSGYLLGLCLAALVAAIGLAGKSIERSWQETTPSRKRQRVNTVLTKPILGTQFLRRKLRRALERNPIGWLEQYSWHARLTKWGWCSFVVFMELILASDWKDAWATQSWIAFLLLLGLVFSAAGSFRRERETGALELLLVTPLHATQIIQGRLYGIWMQYLPSVATLFLSWAFLMQPSWMRSLFAPGQWERAMMDWLSLLALLSASFITLPIIGLYFSLRRLNHLVSWLAAASLGLLIPCILFRNGDLLQAVLSVAGNPMALAQNTLPLALMVSLLWQAIVAVIAAGWLYWDLARRRFTLN